MHDQYLNGRMDPKEQPNQGGAQSEPKTSDKSQRGFAAMDPQMQKRIASLGGKAAHKKGNAHEFTTQEAREAGRKGGMASRRKSA